MAGVATLVGKWRMGKLRHQLGLRRLVRIVALRATRSGEGLSLMRFDQLFVFYVVASDAERGHGLGEVKVELLLPFFADFMRGVAGIASHIERGVTAAFFRDICSLRVAGEAKIVFFVARSSFEQLKLVVGSMRVVALDAVANRWRMDRTLQRGSVFIGMAGDAERLRRGGRQLDTGNVFVDANFVAT